MLISSKTNADIKWLKRLIDSKKERDEQGLFVCEGARLSLDGAAGGQTPVACYYTAHAAQKFPAVAALAEQCPKAAMITDDIAAKLADTHSPQGVFAVYKKLDNSQTADTIKRGKKVLLSAVQDPGNVGAIMRSCEAFGVQELILSEDCADRYSAKVLRASMGGIFRLPTRVTADLAAEIADLRRAGTHVYAAALTQDSHPVEACDFAGSCAVLIGNEGNGLTDGLIASCDGTVMIPMPGGAESLNAGVAAGILIWEMTREARRA